MDQGTTAVLLRLTACADMPGAGLLAAVPSVLYLLQASHQHPPELCIATMSCMLPPIRLTNSLQPSAATQDCFESSNLEFDPYALTSVGVHRCSTSSVYFVGYAACICD